MIDDHNFLIKSPGRVFLFGEHSDYLGLEVISAALNYSIDFHVTTRDDDKLFIDYLDLAEKDSFELGEKIVYRHSRDYLRSAYNVLIKRNIIPKNGANIKVSGTIPIAAGLSSSSALSVASILCFSKLAGVSLTKREIAELAFKAEVVEFGESGGMMDHMSSVYGNIIHVDFGEEIKLTELPTVLTGLVIGDSLEKKQDTVGDIRLIRSTVESGYSRLSNYIENYSHRETDYKTMAKFAHELPEPERTWTLATIRNRDITQEALLLLSKSEPNPIEIGSLIDKEHLLLRDDLNRSTKKIEKMIKYSKKAGALGGKINGSGEGGTMLAYAPGNEKEVAEAIKKAGGEPYIVKISDGASIKILRE
ncbi:MAG: GHMP kinase [Asgard group archaeon]|nr:GHMP kinase [Asgard group archaeon]